MSTQIINEDDLEFYSGMDKKNNKIFDSVHTKNMIFYDVIKQFPIKDKRKILSMMRLSNVNVDTLFPCYGITAGEFSTWFMLTGNGRKK